jgi:hypothetical protein
VSGSIGMHSHVQLQAVPVEGASPMQERYHGALLVHSTAGWTRG